MNARRNSATRVTAVVASYRSRDSTAKAIASLLPAHDAGLLDCIVVDNASGDGTVEHLREHHPWVEVIANEENVGFGRGCNQAIAIARTPYVLLLNPDAVFRAPDLERLLALMDTRPRAGMAGPALRGPDGGWQHAGGSPSPLHFLVQTVRPRWMPPTRTTIDPGGEAFRTDWLCGAVVLLRTSMLEDVGVFDPRFFLYFEESDLCRRAVARGWELWAVGCAMAEHVGGVSARTTGLPLVHGCIAEHFYRSRFRYFAKHHGYLVASLTEIAELGLMTLMSCARWALGRDTTHYRTRIRAPILGLPPRRAPGARR